MLAAAWFVDLITPQLFVVALLMNGPIALSSVAESRALTVQLLIAAELANGIAAYVNGVAAHYAWDPIALGDRALIAGSFVLVAYLSAQTRDLAAHAAREALRSLQMRNEQALRKAIDRVRTSLSTELVLLAVVRELHALLGAQRTVLYTRTGVLDQPLVLSAEGTADGVAVSREPLPPQAASVLNRLSAGEPTTFVRVDDLTGRVLLEHWHTKAVFATRLLWREGEETYLFALPDSPHGEFDDDHFDLFSAFTQQAALALNQAALFQRLAAQNDEIVQQRNVLHERNNTIRDIVYALAHDLRTPLSAANTTMRQALGGAYGELPAAYKEILRTTIGSNDELRRLAETLLLVARYELGETSTVREPVEVNALVRSVVDEMGSLARERGIALRSENADPSTVIVRADSGELRRALLNLVANAFAATPKDGEVVVHVRKEPGSIVVDIIDDGYGVPPDAQPQLFERFSAARGGGGTGLGLNIVRLIAESHGGKARYAPRTPRGSIFTIELPIEERPV